MSRLPNEGAEPFEDNDAMDFDLDLDDLDDAALQRLLEEDPGLEEELRAIEAAEAEASQSGEHEAIVEAEEVVDEPGVPPMMAPTDQDEHLSDEVVAEDQEGMASVLPPMAPVVEEGVATALDADDAFEAYDVDEQEPSVHEEYVEDDEDETSFDAFAGEEMSADVRPVPRINIHVFCLTDGIADLIEKAAGDRRLAKVHLNVQSGDAFRAAEYYNTEPTPNLIILEADKATQNLLNGLDQLAQVCDPSTRVIVIGQVNDIALYRELMNRGISDYIVKPKSPLQIISTIGDLYADPSAPPIGKTHVFVGARGGAGSSSVCHNVAWSMAEFFKTDTVLMDLDLAFGTAGLDFEHDPSQGLVEALISPERLDDVLLERLLQKCTDRLDLFVAPNALERDYDLPADSFEAVVDIVRHSAPAIVVDLPHVWSGWARQMLQSADEIILTATPDLASFRNAKNIAEIVKSHRTNDAPPVLILNQVGVPKRPEVPVDQFEDALELEVRAVLPWEPVVFGTCATNAQPLLEVAPKSKITQEINKVASMLLGQADLQKSRRGFSLKSLFAKRG